jgi:flavin reductase
MADGSAFAGLAPGGSSACQSPRAWPRAEPTAFKDGIAHLASGVAVAACWADGGPRGLLVSSLTSLSTEPPRVLFCVRKATSSHDALLAAAAVSLSILSREQQAEAERFSRPDLVHERFGEAWRLDPRAPPSLRAALVSLAGPIYRRIDAGTHTVFILDVSEAVTLRTAPLLYFGRRFETIALG